MPTITTLADQRNEFLARREIVCDFEDAAGRLKRLDAVDAVTKEHSLEGKLVIPIRLQNHVGKSHTTGTFFVYEDEALARKHVDPSVFARIEKLKEAAKAASDKAAEEAAKAEEEKAAAASESSKPAEESKPEAEKAEAASESSDKPAEAAAEAKPEADKKDEAAPAEESK